MVQTTLSKQQLKSKKTKERIFQAAKDILKRDGYDKLSIKNICERAGVSNGSFYHHFQTKDDLLSYYIEELPVLDSSHFCLPKNAKDACETIVDVYLNYVDYCKELGVDFLASYYTPKNKALNPVSRTKRNYPIVTVQAYLEKAIEANILSLSFDLDKITTDIRMIVIGNVFEWCMRSEDVPFEENMRRSLTIYLTGVIKDAT